MGGVRETERFSGLCCWLLLPPLLRTAGQKQDHSEGNVLANQLVLQPVKPRRTLSQSLDRFFFLNSKCTGTLPKATKADDDAAKKERKKSGEAKQHDPNGAVTEDRNNPKQAATDEGSFN